MPDGAVSVLERAIVGVQRGALDSQVMAWVLAASTLAVASATEVPEGGLDLVRPLVVQPYGRDFLALSTSVERVVRPRGCSGR